MRLSYLLSMGCVALGIVTAACDGPHERIGVELTEAGDLKLLYNNCRPADPITQISLVDLHGNRGRRSDDSVLWKVTSTTETDLEEFVIGREPPGFDTIVAFPGLSEDSLLDVTVATRDYPDGESFTFKTAKLHLNEVLAGRDLLSEEKFREMRACDG